MNGANVLVAVPVLIVSVALASPLVVLDGRRAYVEFLFQNPFLVTSAICTWGILLYWVTRRAAALVLLRGSGAKLKIGNGPA